jgi:hypothetical protein
VTQHCDRVPAVEVEVAAPVQIVDPAAFAARRNDVDPLVRGQFVPFGEGDDVVSVHGFAPGQSRPAVSSSPHMRLRF